MSWTWLLHEIHQFLVGLATRPGTAGVTKTLGSGYDRGADEEKQRENIVEFCRNQLGEKYVFGKEVTGKDSDEWDCSEMVEAAYRDSQITICDGAQGQYDFCKPANTPLAGDLGFLWSDKRNMIGHVMVSSGQGTVVHAVGGRGVVEDPVEMWVTHPRWRGWRRHRDFIQEG